MPILSTILGLLLIILIAKAIFETIWGICLIINGIFWHTIAFFLDVITFIPRTIAKRKQRKQRAKKLQAMMADPLIADLIRIGSYRPQQP